MFKRAQHIMVLVMLIFSFTKAVAQVAMPDTVCVGAARIYQVNSTAVLSTYTWKVDGVTQPATGNGISITWNTAGTFQLSVQEHGVNGCDGDVMTGLVFVSAKPLVNAGPDTTICFGKSFMLQGSGGTAYQWQPSTYLSGTGVANPVATIPAAGNYLYVLTANGNSSCQSSASDTVKITVLPQALVFAGNDTTTGLNQPVQLHASDVNNTGFTSYTWSPSFGLNDRLVQNPVSTPDHDVTYTVTAATGNGCVASDALTVRISLLAEIYVPSAFAPNGINKLLHAIPVGIRAFRYFAIYNGMVSWFLKLLIPLKAGMENIREWVKIVAVLCG